MILILIVVFCHSLIRFLVEVLRGSRSAVATNRIPSRAGPTGYAQPERPIHVILTGDEEILTENNGASWKKVTPPPPAYGLWRSSVVSDILRHYSTVLSQICLANSCIPEN